MIQDLIVKVDAPKPLNTYGDGYVLLYDAHKGCFFVTTREALFAVQDEKIKRLEAKMEKFIENQNKKTDAFMKQIDDKFSEFLETYKNTNSVLIDMVEAVIKEE